MSTRRKVSIVKLVVIILVVLLICTLISRTIYNLMLPKVEIYTATSGTLTIGEVSEAVLTGDILTWNVTKEISEYFEIGEYIEVYYTVDEGYAVEEKVDKVEIKDKISDENGYVFSGVFDKDNEKLFSNSVISIVMRKETRDFYAAVIPKYAIIQDDDGSFYVNILSTRKGLFSEELVVEKAKVELLNQSKNFVALVEGEKFINKKVVVATSKEISAGTAVRIEE